MKVEITQIPEIRGGDKRRVAFHSFVNVLHVLRGELDELEEIVERPDLFADHRTTIDHRIPPLVEDNVDAQRRVAVEVEFLEEVFAVAATRIDEILLRYNADGPWVRLSPAEIAASLRNSRRQRRRRRDDGRRNIRYDRDSRAGAGENSRLRPRNKSRAPRTIRPTHGNQSPCWV